MKKLLLSLGVATAIVAPITTIVACGHIKKTKTSTTKEPKTSTEIPKDIVSIVESDLQLPTADDAQLPSTIVKPIDGDTKNVHYTFTKWQANDDSGQIAWEATLTSGKSTKTLTGRIEGFKARTQVQEENPINSIVESDLQLPTADDAQLPSTIVKPIDGDTKNVHYTFTKWQANDDSGQIAWEATLTSGKSTKTLTGRIEGFKARTQVQEENPINSIVESDLQLPTADDAQLPSTIVKPIDGDTKNVHYTFTKWQANDDSGQIAWEATLTSGKSTKTLTGRIEGFKARAKQRLSEIISKAEGALNDWTSTSNDISKIINDLTNAISATSEGMDTSNAQVILNRLNSWEKVGFKYTDQLDLKDGFFYQTSDGTIYVGTHKHGLKKLVDGKLVDVDPTDVSDGFMHQTSDGTIYVGTYEQGLKKLVDGKLVDVDPTDVSYGFMHQTSDGTIYVVTYENGLKKLVDGKLVDGKLVDVDPTDVSSGFMYRTSDGTIYAGTYMEGLKKLVDGKLVDVDPTDVRYGFMHQTSDGTIYVGTHKHGLKKLVDGKLVDVDPTDVSDGFMHQTSDGTIYVGTYEQGLKKLVDGKLVDVDPTDVSDGFMHQTSDGTIYVGSKSGIRKLELTSTQ